MWEKKRGREAKMDGGGRESERDTMMEKGR